MYGEIKTTLDLVTHEARAEHAQMHHLLAEAREQMKTCKIDKGGMGPCMAETIGRLQERLTAHFAREEKGGWLEEAVVRAPHLAKQLTAIEHEHGPLLEQLRQLYNDAAKMPATGEGLTKLEHEFEAFATRLLAHEEAENAILCQGFNEDMDLQALQ
jgi:iron-sulfur cluster repair protein YtfE (RIC family)